jgi:hypothetical protein
VNQVPAGNEAQRHLERRALRNASRLAEKLGYRDFLDRRTEKTFVAVVGVAVAALVAALVVSAMVGSKEEEGRLALQRCQVASYVEVLPEMERLVNSRRDDLTPEKKAAVARSYATDEARYRCKGPSRK